MTYTCCKCGAEGDAQRYASDLRARLEANQHCFTCDFWSEIVQDYGSGKHFVVDGHGFTLGPEDSKFFMRGFGGRPHTIKFKDGRTVVSTNLWHRGDIPEAWRNDLPNDATFVQVMYDSLV